MRRQLDAGRNVAFDLKDGFMIIPFAKLLGVRFGERRALCALDFGEERSAFGLRNRHVGRFSIVLLVTLNHII